MSIEIGMTLRQLLQNILAIPEAQDCWLSGLVNDSRQVRLGDCFCACEGSARYLQQAINAGARAVLIEAVQLGITEQQGVPVISVPGLGQQLGVLADRFYRQPSRAMTVIGVTGTNGKTSVSHFIAQALDQSLPFSPAGVLGTIGNGRLSHLQSTQLTTQEPLTLHRLLAELREQGVKAVAMEASSHGLEQSRVAGVDFDVAVFTNLSRDHLDYHGNMDAYGMAKRRLFLRPELRAAVLNLDDLFGLALARQLPPGITVLGYSLAASNQDYPCLHGSVLSNTREGLVLAITSPYGPGQLQSKLFGQFNAYNLLAALASLLTLNIPLREAISLIARVNAVPGRMQTYYAPGQPLAVVDYAHTPDGLEKVLQALREVCPGRLWCVFGCGGDRDSGKRPLMGRIAEQYADRVVVTNDNPRHEDPQRIIDAILTGMHDTKVVTVEPDRALAISLALATAVPADIVLIAGKGHENYQQIGDQILPFNDGEVVQKILNRDIFDIKIGP